MKMIFRFLRYSAPTIMGLALLVAPARSAFLENVEQSILQPDGSTLACLASGDEHHHWLHDSAGYVIVQDPDSGWFVYAEKRDNKIVPTQYVPGKTDPVEAGLVKNVQPDRQTYLSKRSILSVEPTLPPVSAPRTGQLNNLVVFIRFAGETDFSNSFSTYDNMFNSTTTTSMRQFYLEASYNTLTIDTTFLPTPNGQVVLSYQDIQPRAYFRKYNEMTNPTGYTTDAERTEREHSLLARAIAGVGSQLPAGMDVDMDNDGRVDNVCFIVKGSAEGWSDLLWPHMWSLYSRTVYLAGARVYTFNFQLETSLGTSNSSVLAHEMGHSLGLPDLYHYNGDGLNPVGEWDLMAYNRNPPQHMNAYMKWRYLGWISQIPFITKSGVYSLNPISVSTNNAYRIASPISSTEYFVVEYRGKTRPFETSLPGPGLVVYRINTARNGQGNADGPPDEVYVFRPGGTPTGNGSLGSAFLSQNVSRTLVADYVGLRTFLANGSPGGLFISNVGYSNATISFQVHMRYTMQDAADALRRSAGIAPALSTEMVYLNALKDAPSTSVVDIQDAVRIARKAAGLENNP